MDADGSAVVRREGVCVVAAVGGRALTWGEAEAAIRELGEAGAGCWVGVRALGLADRSGEVAVGELLGQVAVVVCPAEVAATVRRVLGEAGT